MLTTLLYVFVSIFYALVLSNLFVIAASQQWSLTSHRVMQLFARWIFTQIYYFALYLRTHLRKCPLMWAVLCFIMHHNIFRVLIMLVIYSPCPPQVSAGVGSPLVSSTSNQANSCSNHCSHSVLFSRAGNEGWLKSPTTAFKLKYHNRQAALRH